MGLYKNTNGVLSPIAGRGKAEYGASTVRTGTASIPQSSAGATNVVSVTFDKPMPDADYLVTFECSTSVIDLRLVSFDKTATGFKIGYYASAATGSASTVKYTAFKLYTDKEYNDILAAMPSNASASNKLITESSALKVKVKTESITTNSSGYLSLPKGVFAASVDYSSCVLLAWGDNVISKVYINQAAATPSFGTFNPNTAYTVRYHYIET